MNTRIFLFALVAGLMLAEARLSARNTRDLRRRGALEPPGDPFAALSFTYILAFVMMGTEGVWRAAAAESVPVAASGTGGPSWIASGVLLFAAGKGLKYWAIRTLGDRWSFRVLTVPGLPLITTGPYRYVAHPNYIGVVGELAGAAMMFGAMVTGPISMAVFGLALWARVRFETRVLREAQAAVRTS
jgi:methyltransferase